MKKYIQLLLLLVLFVESTVLAYRYTFTNHTQYPLMVGIKLCCAFEELMGKMLKPNKMVTFVHGQDFPMEKFGYCLQNISYVKNPSIKNRINPEKAPWTEVHTTWVKPEVYDDIINFAEALGTGSEEVGRVVAKFALAASTAPATGGTSVAIAGASEGAQQLAKKEEEENKALATNAQEKKSYGIGKMAKYLAKLIAITTCRDRHWDIYEDEKGNIVFISKI